MSSNANLNGTSTSMNQKTTPDSIHNTPQSNSTTPDIFNAFLGVNPQNNIIKQETTINQQQQQQQLNHQNMLKKRQRSNDQLLFGDDSTENQHHAKSQCPESYVVPHYTLSAPNASNNATNQGHNQQTPTLNTTSKTIPTPNSSTKPTVPEKNEVHACNKRIEDFQQSIPIAIPVGFQGNPLLPLPVPNHIDPTNANSGQPQMRSIWSGPLILDPNCRSSFAKPNPISNSSLPQQLSKKFNLTAYAPGPCSSHISPLIAQFELKSKAVNQIQWPSTLRVCGVCSSDNLSFFKKYCIGIVILVLNEPISADDAESWKCFQMNLQTNHWANVVDLPKNTLLLTPAPGQKHRLLGILLTKMDIQLSSGPKSTCVTTTKSQPSPTKQIIVKNNATSSTTTTTTTTPNANTQIAPKQQPQQQPKSSPIPNPTPSNTQISQTSQQSIPAQQPTPTQHQHQHSIPNTPCSPPTLSNLSISTPSTSNCKPCQEKTQQQQTPTQQQVQIQQPQPQQVFPQCSMDTDPLPNSLNIIQSELARSLTEKYYHTGELDFNDRLVDGFYDPGRCPSPSASSTLLSLNAYLEQTVDLEKREVLLIDSNFDKNLRQLARQAKEMLNAFADTESQIRVLSLFVSNAQGGIHPSLPKAKEELRLLKQQKQSNVIPLGN